MALYRWLAATMRYSLSITTKGWSLASMRSCRSIDGMVRSSSVMTHDNSVMTNVPCQRAYAPWNALEPNDYEGFPAGMPVALNLSTSQPPIGWRTTMSEKMNWKLKPGVNLTPELVDEVAKIACALKSLSAYTTLALEREDCPEDLQQIVQDGLDAMVRIFEW